MKTIIIKTQSDLDNLPAKFDEFTVIEIRSTETIVVMDKHKRESSSVEAWGSSSVEAWESSSVEAWGSSRVVARGSSRVEAWGSSSVEAWGSSSVEAWESSSVEAWGSSRVVARGSSRVEAWGSSSVEAWGSSQIDSFLFSVVFIMSTSVAIKKLYDKSTAKFCIDYDENIIKDKHETAQIVKKQPELSFETYLERGYVKSDGIIQKLIKRKKLKSIEVFEVENWKGDKSFVVKRGDVFSHGETSEKAIADLKYKITNRDTSEFKRWKMDTKKPVDEMIRAYRAITGACEFGTKHFCEQNKLKKEYSAKEVISLTTGQFGNQQFAEFFK